MESPINMNDDEHQRILRAIAPYAARIAFLHRMIQIYRYRKTIFIFLFCSFLCLNLFYPVIHIVPPKYNQNPDSNPDFNSAQTLKTPFLYPWKELIQEKILQLSLNVTVDSLKNSNTHILDLLNHQDLNREQKNALRKCMYMALRSVKQLHEANREINKAIDDLDSDSESFLDDYETACTRFRHIDEFLTMAWEDQHTCLEQFRHVGMIDHHEGTSEGQSLLISFVFDLKIPTFFNMSHSLEMAKEIEKDCREMLEMAKLSQYDWSDFDDDDEEEEKEEEEAIHSEL